ncbi:hypothetical protein, partial [Thalassovita aquimarina]|uniref:hypothetical protein n=1 Tax=Thalassovita aquimarina TaxID=2785917 RepID=UPI0035670CC2
CPYPVNCSDDRGCARKVRSVQNFSPVLNARSIHVFECHIPKFTFAPKIVNNVATSKFVNESRQIIHYRLTRFTEDKRYVFHRGAPEFCVINPHSKNIGKGRWALTGYSLRYALTAAFTDNAVLAGALAKIDLTHEIAA